MPAPRPPAEKSWQIPIPICRGRGRNAAISRHVERDPIPYALETDWPVGAAGFEPLHLEIRSAELHPASTAFRRRSGAALIRDAQVRVPPPGLRVLASSEICRGSNPAAPTGQSVSNASHMKVAQKPRGTARFRRYELVSVCGIRQWRRHSCLLSQRAFFGVSFLLCALDAPRRL